MRGVILKYIVVFTLVIVSGTTLMDVSHHVQLAERDIKRLDREIAREEENIRVLKAEWAFLNNPVRLEALAADYIDLISPEAAQLISDVSIIPNNDPQSSIFIPKRSPLHRDIAYDASSKKPVQANYLTKKLTTVAGSHKNGGAR